MVFPGMRSVAERYRVRVFCAARSLTRSRELARRGTVSRRQGPNPHTSYSETRHGTWTCSLSTALPCTCSLFPAFRTCGLLHNFVVSRRRSRLGRTGYIKQSRPFGSGQSHNSSSPYFCVVGDLLRFALLRKTRACLTAY